MKESITEEVIKDFREKLVSVVVAEALAVTQVSPEGTKTINADVYADNFTQEFKKLEACFKEAIHTSYRRGREDSTEYLWGIYCSIVNKKGIEWMIENESLSKSLKEAFNLNKASTGEIKE